MISVVTPSLRQLDWLRLAVGSVLDQQNVVAEQIVQDGGTRGIIEWARGHFPEALAEGKLRVISEMDCGMYDAINRGLQKARGEICAYLNCDEQYLPGALAKVSQFFASHPEIDVLFGDAILIAPDGKPLSYRRSILPDRKHLRHSHLNTLTCATFFRYGLVERGLLFDPEWKAAGDVAWMDRLLAERVRMGTLPRPTSVFTFTGYNLGNSALSRTERVRWKDRQEKEEFQSASQLTVLWHRLRKLAAGAYCLRHIAIEIYTPESPERRQLFERKLVGFLWPADGKTTRD